MSETMFPTWETSFARHPAWRNRLKMSQLSKNLLKTTQKLAGDGVTPGAVVAVCKDHPARDGDGEKFGLEFLPPSGA